MSKIDSDLESNSTENIKTGNFDGIFEYKIYRDLGYCYLDVIIENEQSISAEPGALEFLKSDSIIDMKKIMVTTKKGSLMSSVFFGSELFINTFTAPPKGKLTITFASKLLGCIIPVSIIPIEIDNTKIILCNPNSYFASSSYIALDTKFSLSSGMFGNKIFFSSITTSIDKNDKNFNKKALVFIESYGDENKKILKENEEILIDNGTFLALVIDKTNEKKQLSLTTFKGWTAALYGGEGFLLKITGPAIVFLNKRQSADILNILDSQISQSVSKIIKK